MKKTVSRRWPSCVSSSFSVVLVGALVACCCWPNAGAASGSGPVPLERQASPLLLHSTMDSAQDIFRPVFATGVYATVEEAIPGPAHVTYETGRYATAARIDARGFQYTWPVDGPIRFHGDNFDFADPNDDGGRLDFWIKFNVDPHNTYQNTWVGRSNWGERYINLEFAGSPADFMVDVYSDVVNTDRTNYGKFRVGPRTWSVYENIQQGEWHLFTITWRRNGGPHKAELHLYIDGTQEGCKGCNDYNGNLPPAGSITDFFFSPQLYNNYILFSIDEVYSFDSWDVSSVAGNFADLQIPEGVTVTYPMASGYPTWGSPVPASLDAFEFFVVNYQTDPCECDVYVDDELIGSILTISQAHTEVASPRRWSEGMHTVQVKCDDDRLVSPATPFEVYLDVPTGVSSFSQFKALFGN